MEDNIVTKSIGEFLNQTKNRYNLANEQKIIKAGESPVKRKPFSFWYKLFSSPIRVIGLLALLLAIFFAMAGYKNWEDFFANASVELASIAITILILDYLNEQREDKKLKEQLIRELRSPDSGIALRSLEELRSHDWVSDGSLRGAFLQFANLQKAGLYDADLRGAHLAAAN